jgi:hypothetical protein
MALRIVVGVAYIVRPWQKPVYVQSLCCVRGAGPSFCGDKNDVGRGGIRQQAAKPPLAPDGTDGGRLRRRGGALDRARLCMHAQHGAPSAMVPLPSRAGQTPRRAAPPWEPPAAVSLPASQVGEDQRRPTGPPTELVFSYSVSMWWDHWRI